MCSSDLQQELLKADGFSFMQRQKMNLKGLAWLLGPGGALAPMARSYFQYYKPGAGYHAWHCDAFGDVVARHLAFILYMNDVPGGGTEFLHQRYICEAKKGKVLIFPASFVFPHRSQISQTHEKYILTGWACAKMPSQMAQQRRA